MRSSRGSSAVVWLLALTTAIAAVAEVSAHRRDEYLQAARLDIDAAGVQLELDLTPGIALAEEIVADIDRDRDGTLSEDEQRAYASLTLGALTIEVDGTSVRAELGATRFPDIESMRRGEGTIRLQSTATLPRLSMGRHQLRFRNRHHPDRSVYLANALVPESDRIAITAQRRDGDQTELTIDYTLGAGPATSTEAWLLGGLAAAMVLVLGIRRARSGRHRREVPASVLVGSVTTILATALAVLVGHTLAAQPRSRLSLELADYAQMPITGELNGQNTRGQLARVNFMRDEPGGRRFFVNDLNGPLYIVDKQTKTFTTYLDFNGAGGRPGLFPKLTFERNFATGLTNFQFDPDYARNGVFYTIHMEDPAVAAPAAPKTGVVAGLDFSGYTTTPAIPVPTLEGRIDRETVLIEWTDRNPANTTFEGTAREILRLQQPLAIHPMGEMTFNPAARRGDPDWRVMYIGSGDAGTGEQRDSRRLNPQRLDTIVGKILRIVPDLGEHTATSTVSENGRYRIPNDNPFSALAGARKEIWAYGLRNPHRMIWDIDPARPRAPRLFAFNIGLTAWETVVIIRKGANYGYSLREGTQTMSADGMGEVPDNDVIPVQISDTVVRGTVTPVYPVIQYPHMTENGGDAIAGGFVYRGSRIPALRGKLVFGDITTGRIWYAERADVLAADDGKSATVARIHEIDAGLRRLVEDAYRARGGTGAALPGAAAVSGRGRVDIRFAVDNEGELYILTKSDGMIRKVVGAKAIASPTTTLADAGPRASQGARTQDLATLTNPVASTPESIAAGKKAYDAYCGACHGNLAQGAVKAGVVISIIEEQGKKQPPDLTDDQWDFGSSDGQIYAVIKKGVPPTMMAAWDGRIPDRDIWSIINYIRTLAPKQ